MRATIDRAVSLNDLIDSIPEELVLLAQQAGDDNDHRMISGATVLDSNTLSSSNPTSNIMSDEKPISKSKRVQAYLVKHPNSKGSDVVAALAEFNVKIADVNNAKQKMRASGAKPRVAASSTATPKKSVPAASVGLPVKALEAGVEFVKLAGSVSSARELLIVIETIRLL